MLVARFDMHIISAFFQGEMITTKFGKLFLNAGHRARRMASAACRVRLIEKYIRYRISWQKTFIITATNTPEYEDW